MGLRINVHISKLPHSIYLQSSPLDFTKARKVHRAFHSVYLNHHFSYQATIALKHQTQIHKCPRSVLDEIPQSCAQAPPNNHYISLTATQSSTCCPLLNSAQQVLPSSGEPHPAYGVTHQLDKGRMSRACSFTFASFD